MSIIKYSNQVLIGAGSYIYRVNHRIMEGDCQFDHGPRPVSFKEFWMDVYPVTNERFKHFMDQTGYWPQDDTNFLKHWNDSKPPAELLSHPVVWVSHNDAKAYADWHCCRLPKEEEWQYAAGGPLKLIWPWGEVFHKEHCNGKGSCTTAVDAFPSGISPLGVMDMCGNTWEWTDSVIDDGKHLFALLRGGCYYKAPHFWHTDGGPRPTNHHLKFPMMNEGLNRCETIGFRCVREFDDDEE